MTSLLLLGVAGCGDSAHDAITDPKDLPPLTAEDAGAIRAQDEAVEDSERAATDKSPARGRKSR